MVKKLRIGIIASLLGAMGVVGTTPAQAECIRAEVVVFWSGGTEQTIWPKSNCIYDFGGEESPLGGSVGHANQTVPTGMPNGARVGVWVPVPPV